MTGAETAAACQETWDELHRRTARQTAAIQSGRFLGRDWPPGALPMGRGVALAAVARARPVDR